MSFLRRLLTESPGGEGPLDDFWYTEHPNGAFRGMTPDAAVRISAVYRAVNLLAGDVGQLPLILYERVGKGKERAKHPLAEVLANPNERQTDFEWREWTMACLLLRGNAYDRILPGRRGAVDRLEPIHPAHVRVDLTDAGRRLYLIRTPGRREEKLIQDEVHHTMAFSLDGVVGVTPITLARVGLSLAQAAEEYGARQFTQRPMISGLLTNDGVLDDAVSKRMGRSFREAYSGAAGWHSVPVLEQGTKWMSVGMSNSDAEFLATRKFQITDIARWFGVPPHMIGDLDRATFSNIEHQGIDYVTHSLMPWLKRIERRILKDLILDQERFFAEFLVDGLLRGDAKSRADALAVQADRGVLTQNEWRAIENRNPIAGGDEPRFAQNLMGAPAETTPSGEPDYDTADPAAAPGANRIRALNGVPHA